MAAMLLVSLALLLFSSAPAAAREELRTVSEYYEDLPDRPARTVDVTAYTSRPEETDDTPCVSADGSDVCALYEDGKLTCASNDHPLGAWLHVPGYGDCEVRDRMNRRYTGTGRVDVYMGADAAAARAWGRRTLEVAELGD